MSFRPPEDKSMKLYWERKAACAVSGLISDARCADENNSASIETRERREGARTHHYLIISIFGACPFLINSHAPGNNKVSHQTGKYSF
jgi:hypothetical protein